ncbi:MAG TPA: tetratricopeptide repeat protein [Blastocatellia bacterium]|nr:tetratricopeptide repeat protein [Blastocatellia bacterium]
MLADRWRSLLLTAVCCTSLVAALVRAQSSEGTTIIGKVRTENGRAVPNVIVELQTGNGQPITQMATTNEGDFAFSGLSGASFYLVVNDPGHQPLSERVELTRLTTSRPGEFMRVELTLRPKAGAPEHALSARTSFSQNVPKAAQAEFGRAIRLFKENKPDQAIPAMREAIKLFPAYFDAHFALGNELMKLNRLDEAIGELESARSINARDDRVYQSFGLVLMKQKKPALAAAVFAEAFRLNPSSPQILLLRAMALLDHYSAIADWNSREAAAERERILAAAESELARAQELSEGKLAGVHLHRARLYEKRGDGKRAADELERYLKMSPDDENAPQLREAIKKLRAPAGGQKSPSKSELSNHSSLKHDDPTRSVFCIPNSVAV